MPVFTFPADPILYRHQAWDLVRQIPPGHVAAYGQIARLLPAPAGVGERAYLAFGPRWVGGAMAACPEDVPWQRVINSKGGISPRPGADEQRRLLEEESIRFDERGRVNLKIYGWEPNQPKPSS